MSTPLKIKIIVGSTRANRFSEKPSQWIYELAKQRADLDVELLDLRDYALPFFEEAFPPGYAKDNYDNPIVIKWREKIREADGFILCTPEYNHGYPAVLKNALDYVYHVWGRKAVAFVSWGGTGGTQDRGCAGVVAAHGNPAVGHARPQRRHTRVRDDPAASYHHHVAGGIFQLAHQMAGH